jgi:ADP-heptose:LPS heptosyltransferase
MGIPIVFVLGLFKGKKKRPANINKLAILNTGSIGDNVLMSASINDLKVKFPNAELTVFTGATNFQLVNQIDKVGKVLMLPIINPFRSIKMVREFGSFDVLIDFGPWPRINSIYSFFIPAKFKIGFRSKNQFRHYVYDSCIEHSDQKHEIENYRSLISQLVSEPLSLPFIKNAGTVKSNELIKELGNYCLVHPWPGGYKSYMKEWDMKRWVELINLIHADFDKIIITGAPADFEKTDDLLKLLKNSKANNVVGLAGKTDLRETIDLIANSSVIFSVNTGIAHIAASFDIPQICLHGPTNPKRWRPYSSKTVSITPSAGKFGYLNFGFEYHLAEGNCMNEISVNAVYNAYKSLKGNS